MATPSIEAAFILVFGSKCGPEMYQDWLKSKKVDSCEELDAGQ